MSVARRPDPTVSVEPSQWDSPKDDVSYERPRTVGRYVLWGVIGSGGCATVHLGRLMSEGGFSRTVAVKRLHAEYSADPDFVAMFLDEARVAGRIRHPNVVQSLDVLGSRDAHGARELFMIMDYIEGETLSRLVAKCTAHAERPPVAIVLAIMCGVLRGLHAAHEVRGESGEPLELVHRDVSPQNIVVGVDGVARLLDFGIAKAIGRVHTTRHGDFKGKAAYMAPEQVTGNATKLSDVYSASVVLWEAVTGQRLFKGENQAAVLHKVVSAEVDNPSSFVPGIAAEVDAIVMRGLARSPEDRFPNALAMAEAIEKVGPLASHTEVGEWVRRVARDELAQRASKVALLEGAAAGDLLSRSKSTPTADLDRDSALPVTRIERSPPREPKNDSRRARGIALALVLVLISLGTPLGLRIARHLVAVPEVPTGVEHGLWPTAVASSGGAPSASTATEPATGEPPEPSASAEASAESTPDQVHSAAPAHSDAHSAGSHERAPPPPPTTRHSAPAASAACSPPFVLDSAGRMHFKTECL